MLLVSSSSSFPMTEEASCLENEAYALQALYWALEGNDATIATKHD
jgi:hypothetical protein